jgi:phenylalanine-4-hydroxylase
MKPGGTPFEETSRVNAPHIFDEPPAGCAADWTMPQDWHRFTAAEHDTWGQLFATQSETLEKYAARAFLDGLEVLHMSQPGIPRLDELNARLQPTTGWQVVAVPGWIPNEPFFDHLAHRRFPAANFLRPADSLDYSEEPDMFHDVFGHVPMLTDPVYGDFLVAYGQAGLRAEKLGASDFLGRLWLYTVEFGLMREDGGLKAFGGGLLSSQAETVWAVESPEPLRVELDIPRVMRTDYHFDRFQQTYFVIDSFAELLRVTEETDFASVYKAIETMPTLTPGETAEADVVVSL